MATPPNDLLEDCAGPLRDLREGVAELHTSLRDAINGRTRWIAATAFIGCAAGAVMLAVVVHSAIAARSAPSTSPMPASGASAPVLSCTWVTASAASDEKAA